MLNLTLAFALFILWELFVGVLQNICLVGGGGWRWELTLRALLVE